jgi:hypothetical protein
VKFEKLENGLVLKSLKPTENGNLFFFYIRDKMQTGVVFAAIKYSLKDKDIALMKTISRDHGN